TNCGEDSAASRNGPYNTDANLAAYDRMGVLVNPAVSRALRIAPTRPSIMSDGATMSAPARACDTAVAASHLRVSSLSTYPSTSPSTIFPQWPWLVYSQLHTSVITRSCGVSCLMARRARCTLPSSAYAPEAASSLVSGSPNRMTPPMPSDCGSAHS